MFNNCTKIEELNVGHFNTDSATTLQAMFYNCNKFQRLNVGNWNTENVTNMSNTFYECGSLVELDVSRWKTPLVTTFAGLFNGCRYVSRLNLSNFDTKSATNLNSMFTKTSCDITFSNKDTSQVASAFAMFNVFYGETIDLSGLDFSNCKDTRSFVTVADNLVNFMPPNNISSNIMLTADNLSVDSLVAIINNLATVKNTQILEIGEYNIQKLTDEQLAVAISKNWTVC